MLHSCVVLADKHQNILEGLRGLLETSFGSVVMVADHPSLIEALNKIKPKFAIVDMSLFSHFNISTASQLNTCFPDVKIVVLSDYNEPDLIEEFMSAGIAGFVNKQYVGTDLFEAIDCVQNGHRYISPAVRNSNSKEDQ